MPQRTTFDKSKTKETPAKSTRNQNRKEKREEVDKKKKTIYTPAG
jgi:hypothetical protein